MPPGIVSTRCLRSVGLFSRTNEIPAFAAISRKRMGGGVTGAAPSIAARNSHTQRLFPRRADLRFTRPLFLLLLIPFHDLLILCHCGARLFRLSRGAVGPCQLV